MANEKCESMTFEDSFPYETIKLFKLHYVLDLFEGYNMANESCEYMPFEDSFPNETTVMKFLDMDALKVMFHLFLALTCGSYLLTSLCHIVIRNVFRMKDLIQKQVSITKVPRLFRLCVRRFFKIVFTALTALLIVATFCFSSDDTEASTLAFLGAASTMFTIKYFYIGITDADLTALRIVELFSSVLIVSGILFLSLELRTTAFHAICLGNIIQSIVEAQRKMPIRISEYMYCTETDFELISILRRDALQEDSVAHPTENGLSPLLCSVRKYPVKMPDISGQQKNPESDDNKVVINARNPISNHSRKRKHSESINNECNTVNPLASTISMDVSDSSVSEHVITRCLTIRYLDQDSATNTRGNETTASDIDADNRARSESTIEGDVNNIDLRFTYSVY